MAMSFSLRTSLDKIKDAFERLSDRDRRLLVWLCVGLCALVVVGSIYMTLGSLVKKNAARKTLQKNIAMMYRLEKPYLESRNLIEDQERRMRQNQITLLTVVQSVARQLEISLNQVKEDLADFENSEFKQANLSFKVQDLSLDRLTALLEGIEDYSGDDLVKITGLSIKTRYNNGERLDADLTVSTWQVAQ